MYTMNLAQNAEIHMCMTRCKVCGTVDNAIKSESNTLAAYKRVINHLTPVSLGIKLIV